MGGAIFFFGFCGGVIVMTIFVQFRRADLERRIPVVFNSSAIEQCAQSEQVCHAVAERMGIVVTIPPWQAMVLTPILDPR
jgi:hypothetical protein